MGGAGGAVLDLDANLGDVLAKLPVKAGRLTVTVAWPSDEQPKIKSQSKDSMELKAEEYKRKIREAEEAKLKAKMKNAEARKDAKRKAKKKEKMLRKREEEAAKRALRTNQ